MSRHERNPRARHYEPRKKVPDGGLSQAHTITLQLLFKGLKATEIAQLRDRSVETVRNQIFALHEKAGTHTGRELIYEALSRGWITPPTRYVP